MTVYILTITYIAPDIKFPEVYSYPFKRKKDCYDYMKTIYDGELTDEEDYYIIDYDNTYIKDDCALVTLPNNTYIKFDISSQELRSN